MKLTDRLKDGIVVSCQALPDEPLHGSEIMARMAVAAKQGGAIAIRANSKEDIIAIKKAVPLPVIGIVKRDYEGSDVYITPTYKEVDELLAAGVDMIAFDATNRKRPEDCTLESMVSYMKNNNVYIMADVSTLEEAIYAEKLGVDCVSTTLSGYTPYSPQQSGPDFDLVEKAVHELSIPVIAEGRIKMPSQVDKMFEAGAHCVVVGGAITRPQLITQEFTAIANRRRTRLDGDEITG